MADRERSRYLVYLSLVIACGSLVAAFYQNFVYTRQLDTIQRNVARGEYIRACRDIIETYFQVKLKVGLMLAPRNGGGANDMFAVEAANAVSRLGGIGTYLANFRDEDIRFRYTQLTDELTRIVMAARVARAPDTLFGKADELFAGLNDDCVRTARGIGL
ncbi:MAG: hypothetical protein M5U07_03400 [Xanthobacteraceae bacterium]|nr:hypothetical protein [Xanthobacteraceae bacterium]PWB65445.1 MAG: hypothetical protein C3F17_04050 [Bradyrhizobiaceae bacterium]